MPATPLVTFEITPTARDLRGRFEKADRAFLEARRSEMRVQGRRYVALAQAEAPGETFPKSIRFRTFIENGHVGFSVTSKQPLGKWITEGTRPHVIAARRAGALRFVWPRAGGGVFFFKSVNHPGTKPNRFHGRAFRRWLPGARAGLLNLARKYTRTISG